MILLIVLFVMMIALGIVTSARGAVAIKPSLRESLDYFASTSVGDTAESPSLGSERLNGVLVSLHGSQQDEFLSDLEVVGRTERDHASEVVKGVLGAALILFIVFWMLAGISALTLILSLIFGLPLGYLMVDTELTRQAKKRRAEFEETLVSVLSLMSISMEGGSGLNTAIQHTLSLGEGWVIEALTRAVDEAEFRKETPWTVLEQLGQDLMIPSLIELSATLSLVGTSGARISQTLSGRAGSAREKLLIDRRSEAEAKSGSMGVPLGLMTLAWVLFLAYPAVAQLLAL